MGSIKNCPFCGSKCKIELYGNYKSEFYRVSCNGEDQHSLDFWDDTEKEAIETWNKRIK